MDAATPGLSHLLRPNGPSPREEKLPALPVMLARALDMIGSALVIVTAERELLYRSSQAAALLAAGHGGLRVAGGALGARTAKVGEALERSIELACRKLQANGICLSQPGKPPETWLRLV